MIKAKKRTSTILKAVNGIRSSKDTPKEVSESLHISSSNASMAADFSQEPTKNVFRTFLDRFVNSTPEYRHLMLLDILKECDPFDMKFLNQHMPRLHRDFLNIPNDRVVMRILEFISPHDLITIAQVCRSWRSLMFRRETWYSLYESIGLKSMAHVFYIKGTARDNARRFYSYGNWAHGIFYARQFQAHTSGILCMAFDGKYVATGSTDRTSKVFLLKTGQCLRTFEGHDDAIHAIQFDEEKLVTGSADKTIKIWSNKDAGALLGTLTNHSGPITVISTEI